MILQALKEYYDRKAADPNSGIAPLGWERKEIPFLIVLDDTGLPIGVEDTREIEGKRKRAKSFLVPQAVKRSVDISANALWDNVEYAVGIACKGKPERVRQQHDAFLALLREFPEIPALAVIRRFLDRPDRDSLLSAYEAWKEAKESCAFLSFKLARTGVPVFETPAVVQQINQQARSNNADDGICLVTGSREVAECLHPAIKGVQGANTTGGNIVSFNFPAATSFGRSQGLNAPVGKTTAFAYTTALNTLLGKDSRQKMQVGDATTVFWAAKNDAFESQFSDFWAEPPKDDPNRLANAVAALFKSVDTGAFETDADETVFYVLGLSPNAARISVRFWHCGPVMELAAQFRRHFDDLRIVHGPKDKDDLSLWRLLVSTAVQGKSENIAPNLAGNVMRAILEGLPYPETLLQAALVRIKAEREVTYPRAKLIKGCINRALRQNNPTQERSLAVSLDKENNNIGYRLGRLFAVLERLQEEANPGINATIRDRYYGAASGTPVSVFPVLMRLKNHHLSKLENVGRRVNLEKLIGEIVDEIGDFPPTLGLADQGRFAIGYYHQQQAFFVKKQ